MTRALYVLGAPGTGKTTLMHTLLTDWDTGEYVKVGGGFGYEALHRPAADQTGAHLGRTRPDFGGTDALAMNALPAAVDWAISGALPDAIYGEGARLGHVRFLSALHARTDLLVVLLTASAYDTDRRCANRGSAQNANWRKGATTRAANAFFQAAAADIPHLWVDTTGAAAAAVADAVREELGQVAR